MNDLTGQTLIGNYYLEAKKGSGKIAEVYKAWDNQKSTHVAVKVLKTTRDNGKEFYDFFSREAELMAHLEHPNIVRFYDFCRDGATAFIVMDWIEGQNLKEIIQSKNAPLELGLTGEVFKPICSALNYAHTQKIIHCDIKPSNIMISAGSKVMLADFGISKHISQRTTGGTPPYMAPEQFTGEKLTPQTDIYGLGITLYEMLSGGKVPYRGETNSDKNTTLRNRIHWEVTNLPYPGIRQFNPKVTPEVEAVIRKALQKNAALRYRSAIEMAEAFDAASARMPYRQNAGSSEAVYEMSTFTPQVQAPGTEGDLEASQQAPGEEMEQGLPVFRNLPPAYRGAYLVSTGGEWRGFYILLNKATVSLGRSSASDLRLRERSISRQHAVIQQTREGIFIYDQNSMLGTMVNGQLLKPSTRLFDGDVIQVGYEQLFEFFYR